MAHILFCRVDETKTADRLRLRADHLSYIRDNKSRIISGGPTLHADGSPETMVLCVDFERLDEAKTFIAREPYNRHGVFSDVSIHRWARVLPEAAPGELDLAVRSEREKERQASERAGAEPQAAS